MKSASLRNWGFMVLLAIVTLSVGAQTSAPAAPVAETLAKADTLRKEGSFRLARELYEEILTPEAKLDAETRAHAQALYYDCMWRERQGGESFQKAEKELARLVEDLPADSRWRAEAAESLGDYRKESAGWYDQKHRALQCWLKALKYWGEATDMEAARPRYVALNFKIADYYTQRLYDCPPPYYGILPFPEIPEISALGILPPPPPKERPWEGDLVCWAMRNVLRVTQEPAEKAHALYQLGVRHRQAQNIKDAQWEKETEDYLKQAAAIRPKNDWTDKAYWDLAQDYENHQRYVEAAATLEEFLKNFEKSQSQFYDQVIEAQKRITQPSAGVQTGDVYALQSNIRVSIDYRNIDSARLRVVRIAPEDYIAAQRQKDPGAMLKALAGAPVKEQAVEGIVDEKKFIPHNAIVWLEPLKPGIYVAQVEAAGIAEETPALQPPVPLVKSGKGGRVARQIRRVPRPAPERNIAVFRVSELALAGRATAMREDRVFTANAATGQVVAGARVWGLFKVDPGKPETWVTREAASDSSGVGTLKDTPPPSNQYGSMQVIYFAEKDGQFAQSQSWSGYFGGRPRNEQNKQWMIYTQTDRPAYRPGDAIQWKAILRVSDDKSYKLPDRPAVYVRIRDERGGVVTEGEQKISEYGSITGSFTPDRKVALGMLNFEVAETADGRGLGSQALARLEEYKLPEYKVSVEAGKEQVKFGAAVPFTVAAEYYFGGPVSGADVEIVVHRRAFWPSWMPPRPYPWYYEDAERWERKSWMPWIWPRVEPEQVVLNKKMKSDAEGKVKLEVGAMSEEEVRQARDRGIWGFDYRVEARVVDPSRREVKESGSVKVARTAFAAYLNPKRYLYLPGDPVKIDIKTLDPNDRPVAAEGFVTMFKRNWNKEKLNDKGQKAPGYDDVKMVVRPAITNKDGDFTVEFTPDAEGFYLFRFESKDKFGADVKGETCVFVASKDTRQTGYRAGGVGIITDKDTYTAGETAHVLLTLQRPGAAVWFGVEGETVHDLKVVPIEGSVKLVDVPITVDSEPNVFFTAVAMFDYQGWTDTRRIVVPPKEQFLDVKVKTAKGSFKPGEKTAVEVEVRDATGEPVQTELSLGVADAAVWAIQGDVSGDIRQAFWSRMRNLMFNVASSSAEQYTQIWRPKKDNPNEYEDERQAQMAELQKEMVLNESSAVSQFAIDGRWGGSVSGTGALGMRSRRMGLESDGAVFAESAAMMMPAAAPMPMRNMPLESKFVAVDKTKAGLFAKDFDGKEMGNMQPATIRTNFSATAFWMPAIVTGKDGKARGEVSFPDSLTTWKITARADDKQTRVGEVRSEVKTTKPVLVRPEGPRFFIQGDAVILSAIVNNNTSQSLPVEVSLNPAGLKFTKYEARETSGTARPDEVSTEPVPSNEPKIRIMVAAQGQRRVDWRVLAEKPGEAKIKTTALSAADSDAVEKSFPIYEYGIEQFIASGATIRDEIRGTSIAGTIEKKIVMNIPAERREGSEGLTIWIEPTLARTMVNALDYLADYPYGCVEQTLSRFVPAVLTMRVLRQFNLHKPDLEAKLPDMIKAGVSRLEDFQHADGGWGWWKEGQSDLYMSAYVVQGLAQAAAIDAAVPREMLVKGIHYLTENIVKAADQPDLTAFILYALSCNRGFTTAGGASVTAAYDRLWPQREKLNPYARALFALACRQTGQGDHAAILARNLRNGLIEDKANGTAHWGSTGIFYHWSEGGVESTAYALRALLAIEPDSGLIEESMTWLVRNRKGNRWENTKDTAQAIAALADYIRLTREDKPDWTAEVEINGERVATLKAEPDKVFEFQGKVEVPAAKLRSGENTIVIRRTGTGTLYASAWLTYFTKQAEIKSAGNEVFVERRYFRTTLAPTLAGTYRQTREEVKPGAVLKSGDRIEVELNLEAKNNYEYLVIEDMKAAGMEPTEVQSGGDGGGGLSTHRELRDEKTAFFVTNMPEGKHTLKYELRAEIPGIFNALPTLMHAMYVPEIRANSTNAKVEIRD